jgi:hypothetical protein
MNTMRTPEAPEDFVVKTAGSTRRRRRGGRKRVMSKKRGMTRFRRSLKSLTQKQNRRR